MSSDGICTQKSQLLSGTGSLKDTTQAREYLLTKSDEHFAELGLAFEWSLAPNLDELNDLFQRVRRVCWGGGGPLRLSDRWVC